MNNSQYSNLPIFTVYGFSDESKINKLTHILTIKKPKYTKTLYNAVNIVLKVQAISYKKYEESNIYITNFFKKDSYTPYVVQETECDLFSFYYKINNEDIEVYIKVHSVNTKIDIFHNYGNLSYVRFEKEFVSGNIILDNSYTIAESNSKPGKEYILDNNLIGCTSDSSLKCKKVGNSIAFSGLVILNSPSTELIEIATIPKDIKLPLWSSQNAQVNMAKASDEIFGFVPVFLNPYDNKLKAYCNIRSGLTDILEIYINLCYII